VDHFFYEIEKIKHKIKATERSLKVFYLLKCPQYSCPSNLFEDLTVFIIS